MKQITLAVDHAAKLAGKSQSELLELLEGVAEEDISQTFYDAAFEHGKSRREDQFKRGIKKKGASIDKALSELFEAYEVTDFDTAEEGIKLLTDKLEQDNPQKVDLSTLTPEQVKDLPAYQAALSKVQKAQERADQVQSEFDAYKAEVSGRERSAAALNATTSIFQNRNAITGNATTLDAAKLFLSGIPNSRIGLDENGKPYPLDANGEHLEDDATGRKISWEDFVVSNYSFGFSAADPNKKGGSNPKGKAGTGKPSLTFRTKEEGEEAVRNATTREERLEARKALTAFLATQASD